MSAREEEIIHLKDILLIAKKGSSAYEAAKDRLKELGEI